MFPFAAEALAMAPGQGGGGDANIIVQLVPFILIFAIFWFLIIRPQQKRAKAHRELLSNLRKGDQVYTDSGIRGTITKIGDETVTLEIAPKVPIQLQRQRISEVIKESKAKGDSDSDDGKDAEEKDQ